MAYDHSASPDRTSKVRILLVGNSGCGKSSLAHLLTQGQPAKHVHQTSGCDTFVKLLDISSGVKHSVFVELWDIGARERCKALRPLFYSSISGVLLVHDASMPLPRARASVEAWAAEVAKHGSFVAPFSPEVASLQPGSLPVPYLIVSNKIDLARRIKGCTSLRQWGPFAAWLGDMVASLHNRQRPHQPAAHLSPAKSGLLVDPHGDSTVLTSALQGNCDAHAFNRFFLKCIQRRYFSSMSIEDLIMEDAGAGMLHAELVGTSNGLLTDSLGHAQGRSAPWHDGSAAQARAAGKRRSPGQASAADMYKQPDCANSSAAGPQGEEAPGLVSVKLDWANRSASRQTGRSTGEDIDLHDSDRIDDDA